MWASSGPGKNSLNSSIQSAWMKTWPSLQPFELQAIWTLFKCKSHGAGGTWTMGWKVSGPFVEKYLMQSFLQELFSVCCSGLTVQLWIVSTFCTSHNYQDVIRPTQQDLCEEGTSSSPTTMALTGGRLEQIECRNVNHLISCCFCRVQVHLISACKSP